MYPKDPNAKPLLDVQPEMLEFGLYHPNAPLTDQPVIELIIKNTGTGILQGRLVPMVSWLIPIPISFACKPGDTSIHKVRISTGAPIENNRKEYFFEEVFLVTSNGGERWFTGSYRLGKRGTIQNNPSRVWLIIPAAILLIAAVIAVIAFLPRRGPADSSQATIQPDMIFTEAAKTLFYQMTATAAQQSLPGIQATNAAFSLSLPTQENTSLFAPSATLTPWPRDQYPNPEQFIREYYQAVNSGEYETSWEMLSPGFQQSCCQVAGNDPYVIYTHFWDNVESVEVQTAYLQEWDANPAVVYVTLAYEHSRGDSFEEFLIFYLIAAPDQNSFLIDQVQ